MNLIVSSVAEQLLESREGPCFRQLLILVTSGLQVSVATPESGYRSSCPPSIRNNSNPIQFLAHVEFEVLTPVVMKNTLFWAIKRCKVKKSYPCNRPWRPIGL
jgi:hypothetical protein